MSTLESTISMLSLLPESEVRIIFDITRNMFEKHSSPFAPVNKEIVLRDIDLSTGQFSRNEAREAQNVILELRSKYGL